MDGWKKGRQEDSERDKETTWQRTVRRIGRDEANPGGKLNPWLFTCCPRHCCFKFSDSRSGSMENHADCQPTMKTYRRNRHHGSIMNSQYRGMPL